MAPLSAHTAKKPAVSGQQAYNLNWLSVIIWGGLDSCLFCGCMHHFPVSNVQGHMVDALSAGIEYQIARTDLCCADLTALDSLGSGGVGKLHTG